MKVGSYDELDALSLVVTLLALDGFAQRNDRKGIGAAMLAACARRISKSIREAMEEETNELLSNQKSKETVNV